MARCGCGGIGSRTAIIAGDNVTVSGTGSNANPYIISAEVPCEDVRNCLSAVDGIVYDPATGTIGIDLSPQAGNAITIGPDGGIYAPTGMDCDDVRSCISAGPGIDYDPATGVIGAEISGQAGNNLALGPDGGLYVPTGSATVTVGCGLTGDGSASRPVTVATGDWPYPCSVDDAGGIVTCDSSGVLRSEPRGQISYHSGFEQRTYPNRPVPAAVNVVEDTFSYEVTNPDPCREAFVLVARELDCYMDLPAGAGGAFGYANDETWYLRNTGSSTITNAHAQATKILGRGTLAPGATTSIPTEVTFGRGSGGATYSQVQWFVRVFMISL